MIVLVTEKEIKKECWPKSGFDIKLDDCTLSAEVKQDADMIISARRGLFVFLKNRNGPCKKIAKRDAAELLTSIGG